MEKFGFLIRFCIWVNRKSSKNIQEIQEAVIERWTHGHQIMESEDSV